MPPFACPQALGCDRVARRDALSSLDFSLLRASVAYPHASVSVRLLSCGSLVVDARRLSRYLLPTLLLALFGCNAPSPELAPATVPAAPTSAIPALAFVFLETGERAAELSSDQIREASIGHRTNIERLGDQGILLLAGPFGVPHDPRWRGIFVFDVATLDQALELTATDPAVQMGAFSMRVLACCPRRGRVTRDVDV